MTTTMTQTMRTAEQEAFLRERRQNKMQEAPAIIAKLKETAPEAVPFARQVGAWLWITFPAKPAPETLSKIKLLGFSWNRKREAWQNPCGVFRAASKSHDPRQTYGEDPIE